MVFTIAHTLCTLLAVVALAAQVGRSNEVASNETQIELTPALQAAGPDDASDSDGVLTRTYRITAYCDRGVTAAGVRSGVGQCAAPADVPLGSRIYIPELDRTLIVTDRTHKRFRHNTVDIFIPDRDECLRFGRKFLTCEITPPDEPHRYGSAKILTTIAAGSL